MRTAAKDDEQERVDRSVAVLRRFNRSYTQRIGALADSFLGMGMPLSSARLLFEIGSAPHSTRSLRATLGLDSGYLSRLLRGLEADGLVRLRPDPADRRRRLVEPTGKGRRRWERLQARSDEQAHLIIDPLTPRQRERLAAALETADLLVRAATVTLETVAPTDPTAREAMGQYFAELDRRFPGGFDPGVSPDIDGLAPPEGAFVVAVSDGRPVACGGVRTIERVRGRAPVAEIKRMWVAADWRGAGLGARLLRHLEGRARDLGLREVRLDTNDTLTEAMAMYERAGYRPIPRYNDNPYARHWYAKPLT